MVNTRLEVFTQILLRTGSTVYGKLYTAVYNFIMVNLSAYECLK